MGTKKAPLGWNSYEYPVKPNFGGEAT